MENKKSVFQRFFLFIAVLTLLFLFISFTGINKENLLEEPSHNSQPTIGCVFEINKSIESFSFGAGDWWNGTSNNVPDSLLYKFIPGYPEIVYKKRIASLDKQTEIRLEYNEFVEKYIQAYSAQNNTKMSNIMSVSSYYFPIFEEYLAKYNLPIELKYLAAVESALDPNAISRSGAVGLWQFMKNTSDIFDLSVNSFIDERRDVYKSTDAACRYLEYLFRTFNDWHLALAAYNGGPGMVAKAIARSGGKTDYWELRPYFTQQMQNYVPAFIAMTYLMNYHREHNIFPSDTNLDYYAYDTIHISGPIEFRSIQEIIGLTIDSLKMLNPIFIKDRIPDDNNIYSLVLPRTYLLKFLMHQNELSEFIPANLTYLDLQKNAGDTMGRNVIYHKVLKGETLNRIAIKYRVTVNNILAWNNLPETYLLKFDDTLKIWVNQE